MAQPVVDIGAELTARRKFLMKRLNMIESELDAHEAKDFEEALAIAAKWPSARLGTIEVRPIEEALRLERRYG